MRSTPAPSTSATLLDRLRFRPNDEAAWVEFVQRYGPAIHSWARRWCRFDTDADEVTQETFKRLAGALRSFQYDQAGSFRAWLRKVVRSVAIDAFHDRLLAHQPGRVAGDAVIDRAAARDSLDQALAAAFDLELFEIAATRVQTRVDRATWLAYEWSTTTSRTTDEIARELGMTVANVYVARSRVLSCLQEEVQKLDRWSETDHERVPGT